jgi:A/G-specific adenine glycosylase
MLGDEQVLRLLPGAAAVLLGVPFEGADLGEKAAPFDADWRLAPGTVVHVFTHFRLELNVYCARVSAMEEAPDGCWWSPADALPGEALPSVMKKAIEAALPGATRKRPRRDRAA